MSRTSHARHEHEKADSPTLDAHEELEIMQANSFAHRHKKLIWTVIIGMVILFPLVFGALAVLNAF